MREILTEKTKSDILNTSKKGANYAQDNQYLGKNRYERRKHSSISTSTRDYNQIDMNTFFKKDILIFKIPVRGETDNYKVQLKFNGVLKNLEEILSKEQKELEWKHVMQALAQTANSADMYIHCTCPDWKYRFQWYAKDGKFASNEKEPPGMYDYRPVDPNTNPNNDKGDGCKHTLLVLSNMAWRRNLSRAIINYIKRLQERQERLYQTIVFPKLYGQPYSDEVQLQLFNPDTGKKARNYLPSSRKELQQADDDAVNRTRFKKGNKQGIRFAKNDNEGEEDQVQLDLGLEDEEEEQT